MSHPFEDKLFEFIGNPKRCTRREAREALDAVGGVTDERILSFTDYAVAFEHDGKTKKYAKAVKDSDKGFLILLDENEFFDILEGKSEPPIEPRREKPMLVMGHEENRLTQEESLKEYLTISECPTWQSTEPQCPMVALQKSTSDHLT